ncbi:transcriptional regulator [Streptomyces sp. NEAU-H22]|uniref:transcriptional regulator n=1 Tax=unclassified Streptomyces TaxID=2593676 RepID=UPI002257E08A|nr:MULTISPECIES: transcriptional regulator [unclassified Streptomyces]MCX3288225.1 transcriptional regulator [Streptomyces sp. NEAU-H22]WMD07268.1 transcriptional regulator [Streptomyces sp. FXY-T5]
MTHPARDLLETTTAALAPDPDSNPLVPRIADGTAPLTTLAALALEQTWVIPADRRAFEFLSARGEATGPQAAAFFTALAEGEALAGERLTAFTRACGGDEPGEASYEPLPGCQAYPAYVAWLALNAAPADVVLALTANFSAWGGYCATIAAALRERYGFTDEACAFFDFFAQPAPELDRLAVAAVQEALDTGRLDAERAHTYGRLLQHYEAMFWNALTRVP